MKRNGLKYESHQRDWEGTTDVEIVYEKKMKGYKDRTIKFSLHKHPKNDILCIDSGLGGEDLICIDADALWDFCGRYFKYKKSGRKKR